MAIFYVDSGSFRDITVTGSINVSGGGTLQGTASYAITASYAMNGSGGGATNTGSLLTTASVLSNTITFTKGDASTFSITVATGSGGGSSFPYTGSAIITGSLIVTGSTISTLGFTGSLQGTSSWASNATTASSADAFTVRGNLVVSGSTTIGDATTDTITMTAATMSLGSGTGILNIDSNTLYVDGANNRVGIGKIPTVTLEASGSVLITGSTTINGTGIATPFQIFSGSTSLLSVTGSGGLLVGPTNFAPGRINISTFGTKTTTGSILVLSSTETGAGSVFPTQFYFANEGATVGWSLRAVNQGVSELPIILSPNGKKVLIGTTTDAGYNLQVSGNGNFTNNLTVTGSLIVTSGSTEFQVTNIGTKIGNSLTDTHQLTGSLTITGSLNSPNITGSLLGTSSYAITASYAMNGGGGGAAFPYTGSAGITGSLNVVGDIDYSGEIKQNGIIGVPHTASVGLSLQAASFAATTEGIYTIDGGDPTTYDFTFPDPTLVPHRKIIIANKSETTRVAINATNQPYYQGTRSTYTKNIDSIPAVSTMEFVSDGTNWRSFPASVTPTYNSVDLSGGNYSVYTIGIYRITNASTNTINLPDPLQHEGGRITIINSDGSNAATFGGTYTPVDAGDNAVTDVPLDTASEFVSINGYWYKV